MIDFLTSGCFPKNTKTLVLKIYHASVFHHSIIYKMLNNRNNLSVHQWDEENMIDTQSAHTHRDTINNKKSDEVLVLYNMDGTWYYISEISQRTKCSTISLVKYKKQKQIR